MSAQALSFSHIGLFVSDMDKIVEFYVDVMGFFVTDRGQLNGMPITFLSRNPREHHQLVFVQGRNTDPTTKLANEERASACRDRLASATASSLRPITARNQA